MSGKQQLNQRPLYVLLEVIFNTKGQIRTAFCYRTSFPVNCQSIISVDGNKLNRSNLGSRKVVRHNQSIIIGFPNSKFKKHKNQFRFGSPVVNRQSLLMGMTDTNTIVVKIYLD